MSERRFTKAWELEVSAGDEWYFRDNEAVTLIAAAPDLLQACEAVIEAFTNDYIPGTNVSGTSVRMRWRCSGTAAVASRGF